MENKINELELRIIQLEAQLKQAQEVIDILVNKTNDLTNTYGEKPFETKAYGITRKGVINLNERSR